MLRTLLISASLVVPAVAANAECLTANTGASCSEAPVNVVDANDRDYASGGGAQLGAGDTMPMGEYNVMLNTEYFGLPAVTGDWLYYRVDNRVVKVDRSTMEVLEDVTHMTNAAF